MRLFFTLVILWTKLGYKLSTAGQQEALYGSFSFVLITLTIKLSFSWTGDTHQVEWAIYNEVRMLRECDESGLG